MSPEAELDRRIKTGIRKIVTGEATNADVEDYLHATAARVRRMIPERRFGGVMDRPTPAPPYFPYPHRTLEEVEKLQPRSKEDKEKP